MSKIIDRLREWGCDVDGAMPRMMNDEAFYVSLLQSAARDTVLLRLGKAVQAREPVRIFDDAHYLKGAVANLGLTPMLQPLTRITDALCHHTEEDLLPEYEELLAAHHRLTEILRFVET